MAVNRWARAVVVALLSLTAIGCVAAQPPVSNDEVIVDNPAAVWVSRIRTARTVYETALGAAGDARRGGLITQEQFDTILKAGETVQDAGNVALAALSVYLSFPTAQGTAEVESKVSNAEQLAASFTAVWKAIEETISNDERDSGDDGDVEGEGVDDGNEG